MKRRPNQCVALRVMCFFLIASLTLWLGVVAAGWFYDANHGRYHQPNTGSFYGHVSGRFFYSGDTSSFSFSFQGYTAPKWNWLRPTNFTYTNLTIAWISWDTERKDRNGSLSLPSFLYQAANSTNLLTRERLENLLLGETTSARSEESADAVSDIYKLLQAAGNGNLPPPRHHTYGFGYNYNSQMPYDPQLTGYEFMRGPLTGIIQHHSLGDFVPEYVFVWVLIWLGSVCFLANRISKRPLH